MVCMKGQINTFLFNTVNFVIFQVLESNFKNSLHKVSLKTKGRNCSSKSNWQSHLKSNPSSFFQVSYEDVDRLKGLAVTENMRVPHFLQDHGRYMEHLEKIMEVNELTDRELKDLIY